MDYYLTNTAMQHAAHKTKETTSIKNSFFFLDIFTYFENCAEITIHVKAAKWMSKFCYCIQSIFSLQYKKGYTTSTI